MDVAQHEVPATVDDAADDVAVGVNADGLEGVAAPERERRALLSGPRHSVFYLRGGTHASSTMGVRDPP
jgi:hypothetical protein